MIFGLLQQQVGHLVCIHNNEKMQVGKKVLNPRRLALGRRYLGECCRILEWCVCKGLGRLQCQVGKRLRDKVSCGVDEEDDVGGRD
jgi:hypothetical protein